MNKYLENTLIVFSLLFLYIVLQYIQLIPLRIIVGVLLLIVIPGGVLIRILNVKLAEDLFYGYSAIMGLALQLVFMGFGYMVWMSVFNMQIYILSATILFLALSSIRVRFLTVLKDVYLSFRKPIAIPYLIAVVLSLYYILNFSYSSVATDGALYCDIARNIALRGVFKTNVLNDILAHIGTPIAISLFFLLGDVSQVSANLTALFASTLIIYPLIDFERRIVKDGLGVVSSIIYVTHPMFTLFSSTLFGPEILNILYTLSTLMLFIDAIGENHVGKSILAGLTLCSLNICWGPETPIALLTLLTTFIVLNWKRNAIASSMLSLIVFSSLFTYLWFYRLVYLWLPLIALSISIIFILKSKVDIKCISIFYITTILIFQLFLIRDFIQTPLTTALESTSYTAQLLLGANVEAILSRIGYYLRVTNSWITPPLLILTILYIAQVNSKVRAIPLTFTLFHLILYSLYFPYNWLDRRFLLSAFIMMTLTSSSLLNSIVSKLTVRFRVLRGFKAIKINVGLNLLVAICIIALLSSMYYTHQYRNVLVTIDRLSTNPLVNVTEQVVSYVDKSDVIAVHGSSRVFAWLMDRQVVAISRNASLMEIYNYTKQYNVTMLILNVDELPFKTRAILSGGSVKVNSEYLNVSLVESINNFRLFRIY